MRRIVLILVLHGLLPGLGPATAAAGVPARGEPTVTAATAPGEGHSDSEHGCGVTLHLCGCCVSQPVAVPTVAADLRELAPAKSRTPGVERLAPRREPARPFRPPIR